MRHLRSYTATQLSPEDYNSVGSSGASNQAHRSNSKYIDVPSWSTWLDAHVDDTTDLVVEEAGAEVSATRKLQNSTMDNTMRMNPDSDVWRDYEEKPVVIRASMDVVSSTLFYGQFQVTFALGKLLDGLVYAGAPSMVSSPYTRSAVLYAYGVLRRYADYKYYVEAKVHSPVYQSSSGSSESVTYDFSVQLFGYQASVELQIERNHLSLYPDDDPLCSIRYLWVLREVEGGYVFVV